MIYTKQLGNEYQIYHYLFSKYNNTYINTNIYTVFSNRQEYLLNGALGSKEEIEKFIISSDFIYQPDALTIQHVSGFQDEEEIIEKSYITLVTELYKQKKYNDLKLVTNKFVLKELNLLNSESIIDLNNIAFYAQKAGSHNEAIYLLREILNKDSKRVVAYLNIADSYWELNKKEEAIENYKKYCELMKTQKKDLKKIPAYVFARIKNN